MKNVMRIHVTAVAGTGMGSLAGLLKSLGHEVSGSDVAFHPPMGPALRRWGIQLFEGFDPGHLLTEAHGGEPLDVVVVGNVCRKDNPEAVAAEELGIDRLHIADALRRFVLPGTSPLVVAGTHGKTTTSALCAHLLSQAGLEPGYLVGGMPRSLGQSFRASGKRRLSSTGNRAGLRRPPFVLEGDEYDTAFWEKSAKFLHYGAEVAIVTSIEHDHVDIYSTYDSYLEAFEEFVATVPESGLLIAYAGDQEVVRVAEKAACDVAYYALAGEPTHGKPPHWLSAPATETEDGITFDLFAGGVFAGRFVSPLSGDHNLRNVTAALAAAAQGYGADLSSLAVPLAHFEGVQRRQELLGRPGGVLLYDDFAHHPTAVAETLRGLSRRHQNGRLFALFEPRSATACRDTHQEAYSRCFGSAFHVMLAPLGRSGLPEPERLSIPRLVADLDENGIAAEGPLDPAEMVERVRALAAPGDVVVLLSNGTFGGVGQLLLDTLDSPSSPSADH